MTSMTSMTACGVRRAVQAIRLLQDEGARLSDVESTAMQAQAVPLVNLRFLADTRNWIPTAAIAFGAGWGLELRPRETAALTFAVIMAVHTLLVLWRLLQGGTAAASASAMTSDPRLRGAATGLRSTLANCPCWNFKVSSLRRRKRKRRR